VRIAYFENCARINIDEGGPADLEVDDLRAAEPITSIDITAADTLDELDKALHTAGVKLGFAEMKDPVKDKLKRFGLFDQFGAEFFFPTVSAAVKVLTARATEIPH
jgi:MFS superfamily sulfate permease-like transporter